ncbi:hypothetical protein BDP81DRAFT_23675 [Colletotrichum phormii]|uniref:Uncharacterized protein n=1 Tax=Colletotrichum phormii TaxID=359342 RepID=A0AAJ0EEZ2_9PEZI|nr:uncharacterized protein BDP81DRAFT_23675 [Colletotrichum phormii]KAK1636504.1 hypothetical protein BDP81DRAFT_23675 [Colletotrichum phormii]
MLILIDRLRQVASSPSTRSHSVTHRKRQWGLGSHGLDTKTACFLAAKFTVPRAPSETPHRCSSISPGPLHARGVHHLLDNDKHPLLSNHHKRGGGRSATFIDEHSFCRKSKARRETRVRMLPRTFNQAYPRHLFPWLSLLSSLSCVYWLHRIPNTRQRHARNASETEYTLQRDIGAILSEKAIQGTRPWCPRTAIPRPNCLLLSNNVSRQPRILLRSDSGFSQHIPDIVSTPSRATEIFAKKQGTIHARWQLVDFPPAIPGLPRTHARTHTHSLTLTHSHSLTHFNTCGLPCVPACRPASPSFLFIVRPGPGTTAIHSPSPQVKTVIQQILSHHQPRFRVTRPSRWKQITK